MGNGPSRVYLDEKSKDEHYGVLKAQRAIQNKIDISLQVKVAHYTPSSFPVLPRINAENAKLCAESWKKIVSTDVADPYGGPPKSGIIAFYTEFYDRYQLIHGKY
jgi:hypothetical protein